MEWVYGAIASPHLIRSVGIYFVTADTSYVLR